MQFRGSKAGLMGALAFTLVLASVGCGPRGGGAGEAKEGAAGKSAAPTKEAAPAATAVLVTPASEQVVSRSVPVNGNITALQSVSLSPKISARVLQVSGREGDIVRTGQIIVQQDTADLQRQLEQDLANLQSAKAKLQQAKTNYRLQITQSATGVENAKSQLAQSQENLVVAQKPQRTEEVRQAEIAVEQAKANYDRAAADVKRYTYLVKEGAAAQATLDQYLTTEQVQKANRDNAQQALQISQTGGREESVKASQQQVRQSQIALQMAKANVAQNQAKLDDIHAAEAAVAQNEAAVHLERQQIADAAIRSPIDGVIATRATEPGQQAAPGSSVMTVVSLGTVYFQAQVPETDVANTQIGKPVVVSVDALPGRTFTGKVANLFPMGSTSSRAFSVRVNVPNSGNALRPGMFARGQVIVERRRGVVIPKDALVAADSEGTTFQVFLASENGTKATAHKVKVGVRTATTAEILAGVSAGDQVITTGQDGLKDGSHIRVESNKANNAEELVAR